MGSSNMAFRRYWRPIAPKTTCPQPPATPLLSKQPPVPTVRREPYPPALSGKWSQPYAPTQPGPANSRVPTCAPALRSKEILGVKPDGMQKPAQELGTEPLPRISSSRSHSRAGHGGEFVASMVAKVTSEKDGFFLFGAGQSKLSLVDYLRVSPPVDYDSRQVKMTKCCLT